jgi:hypothetical protein
MAQMSSLLAFNIPRVSAPSFSQSSFFMIYLLAFGRPMKTVMRGNRCYQYEK